MKNDKDFVVWLNERYEMSREEFEQHMTWEKKYGVELPIPKQMCYEERSCMNQMPNIDFDKLFVGAHLYMDSTEILSLRSIWDEIEITHIYGGVVFYKFLEGKRRGEEDYMSKNALGMFTSIYPKVIMKPDCIEMECDCPRVIFKNW